MKTKTAEATAEELAKIFLVFRAPTILQSDNGREFTAEVIVSRLCRKSGVINSEPWNQKSMSKLWPDMKLINGRPRYPQSQGLVERGNQTLENKLASWMKTNNTTQWHIGLPIVVYQMNTSFSSAINCTLYEVVFGQPPRTNPVFQQCLDRKPNRQSQGTESAVMEEDLPE